LKSLYHDAQSEQHQIKTYVTEMFWALLMYLKCFNDAHDYMKRWLRCL